jgi:hypothetical protein
MKQPPTKYGFIGGEGDDAVHKLRRMCGHEGTEMTRRNLQIMYMAQDAGVQGSVRELARFVDLIRADMLADGFDRLAAIKDGEHIHPLLEYNGSDEVLRAGYAGTRGR